MSLLHRLCYGFLIVMLIISTALVVSMPLRHHHKDTPVYG